MIGSKLGIYSQQNQATESLLLDTYPATAAYSLRKLRAAYTGAAIGVRIDTTGQPTYDIGFDSNGNLDTADLVSKAGGNDAYVTTWYDQSGNGNNATNSTASKQPQIVSSGSVITSSSIPAIQSISGSRLDTPAVSMGSSRCYFLVIKRLGAAFSGGGAYHNLVIQGASPFYQLYIPNSDSKLKYYDGAVRDTGDIIPTSQVLNAVCQNSSSGTIRLNGTEILALGSGASALNSAFSFMGYSSFASNAYFSEIIIYNSDESSSFNGIESNINSHYNIYWDGSQTGLLDDYSGASAAYSVRALNSAYIGPLVKVRRSSDNNEQDIYAKYNGDLDRDSLLSFVGANDGFVSTWYDQSGNANNATNLTAANQPQIVSSGTIVLKNSLPTISYNSSTKRLSTALAVGASSVFATHSVNSQIGANYILGSSSPVNNGLIAQGTAVNGLTAFSSPNVFELGNTEDTNLNLATLIQNSNTNLSINGNALTSSTFVGNIFLSDLGNRTGANVAIVGNISECIVYSTDQTANKTEIETNINNYFTIYP